MLKGSVITESHTMKKILLDFSVPSTKEETHAYIAEQMGFPDYYGGNLDALYDMLTSLTEPTAVGIFLPVADMSELDIDLMIYFDSIGEVFTDAEAANPDLAVIFGDLPSNPEYEAAYSEEIDRCLNGGGYAEGDSSGLPDPDNDAENAYGSSDPDNGEELRMPFGEKDVIVLDLVPDTKP